MYYVFIYEKTCYDYFVKIKNKVYKNKINVIIILHLYAKMQENNSMCITISWT